jgi:acyl carrier protein
LTLTPPAGGSSADRAARLLAEFTDMLVTVMGEEIRLAVDITPDTSFDTDLGIESIEMVALTGQIHLRYGDRVDMIAFFADRGLDELMHLTVGDFLKHLAAASAGRAGAADQATAG